MSLSDKVLTAVEEVAATPSEVAERLGEHVNIVSTIMSAKYRCGVLEIVGQKTRYTHSERIYRLIPGMERTRWPAQTKHRVHVPTPKPRTPKFRGIPAGRIEIGRGSNWKAGLV